MTANPQGVVVFKIYWKKGQLLGFIHSINKSVFKSFQNILTTMLLKLLSQNKHRCNCNYKSKLAKNSKICWLFV